MVPPFFWGTFMGGSKVQLRTLMVWSLVAAMRWWSRYSIKLSILLSNQQTQAISDALLISYFSQVSRSRWMMRMRSSRCPQMAARESWQFRKIQSMGDCRQTQHVLMIGQSSVQFYRLARKMVNLEPLKLTTSRCWFPLGTLKSTLPCWYFRLACRVCIFSFLVMSTSRMLFLVWEVSIKSPSQYLFSCIRYILLPLGRLKYLTSFSANLQPIMYLSFVWMRMTVLLSIASLMKWEAVFNFSSFGQDFIRDISGSMTDGIQKERLRTYCPIYINFMRRSQKTSQSWMWLHSVSRASTPCQKGWQMAFFILNFLENFQYQFNWWLPYSRGVKDRMAESRKRAKTFLGSLYEQKKDCTPEVKNFSVYIYFCLPSTTCQTERLWSVETIYSLSRCWQMKYISLQCLLSVQTQYSFTSYSCQEQGLMFRGDYGLIASMWSVTISPSFPVMTSLFCVRSLTVREAFWFCFTFYISFLGQQKLTSNFFMLSPISAIFFLFQRGNSSLKLNQKVTTVCDSLFFVRKANITFPLSLRQSTEQMVSLLDTSTTFSSTVKSELQMRMVPRVNAAQWWLSMGQMALIALNLCLMSTFRNAFFYYCRLYRRRLPSRLQTTTLSIPLSWKTQRYYMLSKPSMATTRTTSSESLSSRTRQGWLSPMKISSLLDQIAVILMSL